MSLKIIPTDSFKRDVKKLKKKYPRITESLKNLNKELLKGEYGVRIGKEVYKKRIRNVDIKKGKSGGFRVIGYNDLDMEKFYLLTLYSKSDKETIYDKEIVDLLKKIGVSR